MSSKFFEEEAKELIENIKKGEKIFNMPYGFGVGCYYKDRVHATADIIEGIMSGIEPEDIVEMPKVFEFVKERIKNKIEDMMFSLDRDFKEVSFLNFEGEVEFNETVGYLIDCVVKYVKKNKIDGISRYER